VIDQAFLKSLFFGVIPDALVFPYPALSSEETDTVHRLVDGVRRFAQAHVDSARIDREEAIPASVLDGLKSLGLFGLGVPTAYGGSGLSQLAYCRVVEEVASIDASLALMLGAHQSIGTKGLLLFGTEAQKRAYLPRLASGEAIGAFALAEQGAGSDAANLQTHAELEPDGQASILRGGKVWVTNGGIADLFTVFARTSPPEEGIKPKITAFLVEKAWGVEVGPSDPKLGVRGLSTTSLTMHHVRVPEANVLGERGRGFKVAVEVLSDGRLSVAAGCVGLAKRLVKLSVERARERRAFGRPVGEFGLLKDKVAQMMAETFAMESMVFLTAGLADGQVADVSVESAVCKVFASESLWRTANESLQVAAGSGYSREQPFERLFRDARVNLVFDGTNEILRCFIALAGMAGAARELADVARAIREPLKGFGLLGDFALRKARSALGRERLSRAHPILGREAVIFEEATADLARNVDKVLRRHGNNIHEMQYTQKRVADMVIDLYAIAAVLSRATRAVERRGEEGARREIDLTGVFVSAAATRLAQASAAFDKNDDELRKAIASRAYADGGYPFDIL
jgi:acyl-CoA dehydrogenase family protein 9